jgi:integrase/recombinase XerD
MVRRAVRFLVIWQRPVRAYLAEITGLAPSTRKRKRAAVASFCKWAVRHDLLAANPMDRIDTIKVPKTLPRPAAAADVAKVLNTICSRRPGKDVQVDRLRDRVLFETIYVCGGRASEICALDVDDFDLRLDDEHVRIHGKGGTVRTVLLDDRRHVALIKLYLARTGYQHGPIFRASINGSGGALSYDAAHHRWDKYCAMADVEIGIHQLRHAHATELINSGVSIEAVRRRLGQASTETTQLYTPRRQSRRRGDSCRTPAARAREPLTDKRARTAVVAGGPRAVRLLVVVTVGGFLCPVVEPALGRGRLRVSFGGGRDAVGCFVVHGGTSHHCLQQACTDLGPRGMGGGRCPRVPASR